MKSLLSKSFAISLAFLATAAQAASGMAESVTVVTPYVRMVPPGARTTAAFMTLKNMGNYDVQLVRAESAVAKTVELHTHIHDNGMAKMRQVAEIAVKPRGETALKPGSYHIMLIGPTGVLKEGEKVAITLHFSDGSSKAVEAQVTRSDPVAESMERSRHDHH